MSRERVLELVRGGRRFLVTCHLRPDADALGSALGWAAILRAIGKDAVVYSADRPPEMLRFLTEAAPPLPESLPDGAFDATFVMDAASQALVPVLPERCRPIVMVDHHAAHDGFGDVVLRETTACATGEVVLGLMRELGLARAPEGAALPLSAALVADTGGFRYPSTRPATLRLAAELMELGVDPWHVAYHLFEDFQPARLKLVGASIDDMRLAFGGRVSIQRVTRAMLARAGADDDMVEGLVNYGRMLRGVEVAVLLWEQASASAPATKVSLRSAGRADVAGVALRLGGGGHRAAAGARLSEDLDRSEAIVLELVRDVLP